LILANFRLPTGWFAPATTVQWVQLGSNLEQNPHMHLLEAYLSLYKVSQDDTFLRCATQIMSIYTEVLRTGDGNKVLEHLDENGRPSGSDGTLIQPGHLYEWYWLVSEYADIADLPVYRVSGPSILDWADRYGLDLERGGIFDLVDTEGRIVSNRKRIWPVTECIKAAATRLRTAPTDQARDSLLHWVAFILGKYRGPAGSWHEYLNRDLEPDSEFMPMSTPYHVAMAALEVERLLGGPGAFGMKNRRSPDFTR
jgi:mannose/cellobiose epimerase-like protein (N-acyl-D-glucosamine 2-epimerase family)